MALTKTQVSELYVAIFNRASEGEGNAYWQSVDLSSAEVASEMLATTDAQEYFGDTLDDNQAFVELIYANTFNKTPEDDAEGIAYWTDLLENGVSRGQVIAELVAAVEQYADSTDPVTAQAYAQFTNRVAVSDYTADNLPAAPADYATSLNFGGGLTVTSEAATVTAAQAAVDALVEPPASELTEALEDLQAANAAKADFLEENETTEAAINDNLDALETDLASARATVSDRVLNARLQDAQDAVAAARANIDSVAGLTSAVATLEDAQDALEAAQDTREDAFADVVGARANIQQRNPDAAFGYDGYEVSVDGELVIALNDNGTLVVTEAGADVAGINTLLAAHQALQAADADLASATEATAAAQTVVNELDLTAAAVEAKEERDEAQAELQAHVRANGSTEALETQLADAQAALGELEGVQLIADAEAAVAEAQADFEAANAVVATAEADLAAAQAILSEEENTVEAAQAAVGTAQAELNTALQAQGDAQVALSTAIGVQTQAQTALNEAQADVAGAEEAVTAAEGTVTTAEGELATASAAVATAQGGLDDAVQAETEAQADVDVFQTLVETYNDALAAYDETDETTDAALEAAYAALTAYDAEAFDETLTAADIVAANDTIQTAITAETGTLAEELADAQADVTTAQNTLETVQAAESAAQTTLNNAQADLTTANAALTAAQQAETQAQANLTAANAAVVTAQADLDAANSAVGEAETALTSAQDELSTAEGVRDTAQAGVDAAQDELNTALEAAVTAQAELNAAQENLDSVIAENQEAADLVEQIANLEATLAKRAELQAEADDAQADFEAAAATNPRVDALETALATEETAQDAVDARAELIAEVEAAQALADTLESLNGDIDAAEAAIEELGFELPITAEDSVFGTAGDDIFLFAGEDATISGFNATGEDLLYVGAGFTRTDLESDVDLAASRQGTAGELEIFFQQDSNNAVLWIEEVEFAGSATNGFEGDMITLTGVNVDDLTLNAEGFVTIA